MKTEWQTVPVGGEPPRGTDVEIEVHYAGEWRPTPVAYYVQKAHHRPRRWRRDLTPEERLERIEARLERIEGLLTAWSAHAGVGQTADGGGT